MGICASYSETTAYLLSLMTAGPPSIQEDAFIQHVFDNADVHVRTIEGLNTFHVMGGIQCITPGTSVQTQTKTDRVTSGTFSADTIQIKYYEKILEGLKTISLSDYTQLATKLNINVDFASSALFPMNAVGLSGVTMQPGWNGFM